MSNDSAAVPHTVLIVGGGIGGMAAALIFAGAGTAVTLIDADPEWRVYGAGITVTGLSLRAFDALGLLPAIRERGFVGAGMRARNADGSLIREIPSPPDPKPIQSGGGIMRPVLHELMSARVRSAGIDIRLGVTVTELAQDPDGVDIRFSDGRAGRFDLVVGADGINSATRKMIFPDAPEPRFTGQGCWRVVADRPVEIDRAEMYFGGAVKVGLTPISQDQMYMFILEHVPDNPWFEPAVHADHVRELLAPFGGHVATVRDHITDDTPINYRPLEWLMMPDPWYVGRVVLIGDAAHATTPHMASGAGLAVEDALVLGEEMQRHVDIAQALRAFMSRRYERAKLVVLNSVKIGEIEMSGENIREGAAMIGSTMQELQAPY